MSRFIVRFTLGLTFSIATAAVGLAQYGGGGTGTQGTPGYKPPTGGYSSSTGIAIGAAAAAGVAVTYLVLHNRGTIVGCVEPSAAGNKLMNEKDKNTYALLASNDVVLAPGERVKLKGKKSKDGSGKVSFAVQKLVKDYGSCRQ